MGGEGLAVEVMVVLGLPSQADGGRGKALGDGGWRPAVAVAGWVEGRNVEEVAMSLPFGWKDGEPGGCSLRGFADMGGEEEVGGTEAERRRAKAIRVRLRTPLDI